MPWVPADTGPRTIGRLPELAPAVEAPDLAAPGILDTIGAAWRTQNIIGSSLSNEMLGADLDTVEQDFNPFEAARGTKYEAYPERLAQLYNRKAFETFRAQVDREEEDRRTLDAAGALGVIAQIGAGVVDPTILVPGGALVRGGKVGYSIGRSALAVGAGSAAGVAVQESILQGTQETRTAEETGLAIGGGAILGALVGAAGAKILDNLAWNNLASRLETDLASKEPLPIDVNDAEMRALYEANVPTEAASAGAAAPMRESLEGLSIAGRAANIAANPVARLNPILRALTSPSAEYRRIATSLMENPIYLKANMEGRASEVAVESLVKEAMGSYTVALERNNELFREMRKAGISMRYDEFKDRIGRALRNNDVDPGGNEYVTKAAREWRENVFEPGRIRAVEAGILAADAKVSTAPSYYHRMYNVPMIEANEAEFKGIVRQWAREAIANEKNLAKVPGDALTKDEVDSYIEEVVNSIYSKITGRGDPDVGENPFRIVANKRGPLKERTFNIEDAKIEKFLESDVEMVGRRYSRVMSADAEIARKFGRADLNEQIEAVRADYAKIRSGVTDERELRKLNAAEKSDVADLKAIRDMLRGQYLPEQNGSNYARIVNAAMTFNYIRAMGGVVAASLADVARPIMVHGLSRFMGDGVAPLVKNLKAFKLSAQEAKLAGTVGERIRDGALSTLAELTDPYARSSPFERWLENGAKAFGKATGMPYWNDFMKSFSSVMTQNRIIGNAVDFGKINQRERAYLAYLGIDQSMAERIAKQFADHGQEIDGVKVASTEDWTDDVARRTYRAAVAKDVDSIIITKGIGDVPLFARRPTGRALLQFKGFALASHQRALIRGLQEDKLNTLSGLIAMSTIGMFIYWLKSVESNRLEDISDNPGRWIAEGLDRSGFLAIPFEINNTAEKFGVPGVYTGMQAMFPEATQKAPASRYAVRSVVDSLFGPTFGLIKDAADMIGATAKMDLTPADINTMRRLTPGASLPVIRSLVEYGVLPELKEAVQ
jgi:hypothetical protein